MIKRFIFNPKYTLFLIFLSAFVLRLLGLINIELRGDFAEHWKIAGEIAGGKYLPLLGPSASINPDIHLGPLYYYLLSIPYLLGGVNYKIAIIFFSILNSLSIFPLYYISKKWFGERSGLQVVILFSVSSYVIQVQDFPWNPYLIPALMIFSLYSLVKVREKQLNHLPILFFLLGLGFSFHATFLFVIPLFLIFIPYKKIPKRLLAVSILLFLIPLSTWFYSEIRNNFVQVREMITVFTPNKKTCSFSTWLATHGNGERCFHQIRNTLFIFRSFSQSLFATRNLMFTAVSFLIVLATLLRTKNSQGLFFLVWILSIFLLFMTYSGNIYPHFFLILVPLPFFIFILFLEKIESINKYGSFLSNAIFLLTIAFNLINYYFSLWIMRG